MCSHIVPMMPDTGQYQTFIGQSRYFQTAELSRHRMNQPTIVMAFQGEQTYSVGHGRPPAGNILPPLYIAHVPKVMSDSSWTDFVVMGLIHVHRNRRGY